MNIWCENCFEIAIEKMKLLTQNLERKISLKTRNSLWNDTYLYMKDTFLKKSHFWRTYFISHRSIVFRDLLAAPAYGSISKCITLNIQWPDTGQSPPCSTGVSLHFSDLLCPLVVIFVNRRLRFGVIHIFKWPILMGLSLLFQVECIWELDA